MHASQWWKGAHGCILRHRQVVYASNKPASTCNKLEHSPSQQTHQGWRCFCPPHWLPLVGAGRLAVPASSSQRQNCPCQRSNGPKEVLTVVSTRSQPAPAIHCLWSIPAILLSCQMWKEEGGGAGSQPPQCTQSIVTMAFVNGPPSFARGTM